MKKNLITLHVNSNQGTHWLRITGKNGATMMSSETYANQYSAKRAAKRLAAITGLEIDYNWRETGE